MLKISIEFSPKSDLSFLLIFETNDLKRTVWGALVEKSLSLWQPQLEAMLIEASLHPSTRRFPTVCGEGDS